MQNYLSFILDRGQGSNTTASPYHVTGVVVINRSLWANSDLPTGFVNKSLLEQQLHPFVFVLCLTALPALDYISQ